MIGVEALIPITVPTQVQYTFSLPVGYHRAGQVHRTSPQVQRTYPRAGQVHRTLSEASEEVGVWSN